MINDDLMSICDTFMRKNGNSITNKAICDINVDYKTFYLENYGSVVVTFHTIRENFEHDRITQLQIDPFIRKWIDGNYVLFVRNHVVLFTRLFICLKSFSNISTVNKKMIQTLRN